MNKIKALRSHTGLSQKGFAEAFSIPVRTLQQWEQQVSMPPDYVISMLEGAVDASVAAQELSQRHHIPKKTSWKVCIDEPFKNCERIYPIQQRKVRELIDTIAESATLNEMWIFGSSTTESCHMGSDVDVFVDAKVDADASLLGKALDFEYDIWTPDTVDERLRSEIMTKGVKVYG